MTYNEWRQASEAGVFTIQLARVVPLLGDTKPYFASWEWSAARHPHLGPSHAPAYSWALEQFAKRKGKRMTQAPIWGNLVCTPDRGRKHDDEHLVHLVVPQDELLVMNYRGWCDVLWDQPLSSRPLTPSIHPATEEVKRASWEHIFDVPDDVDIAELQVMFDRIERSWIRDIIALGPLKAAEESAPW